MSDYRPSYQISDEMLTRVADISEKIGQLKARGMGQQRLHLRRASRIRSVHSSLRIEANSLSLGEVCDVIEDRRVLGPAREIQEVKNAYDAYEQIARVDPYSLEDLKRVHGVMMKYLAEEAGEFRRGSEGVYRGGECIFMAPPAPFVSGQMQDLFGWMRESRRAVHPLILSAVFHYEFVFIHPFTDGNGRMARLWHTALLSRWQPVFEFIPIESQIEKYQEEYYEAIARCHSEGACSRLIEFMLEMIDAAVSEILANPRLFGEALSEYEKRLLEVMEAGEPYTAQALLDLLGLKSREALRKNYLGPAIAHGYVAMTLPDKPQSRNQRYVRRMR